MRFVDAVAGQPQRGVGLDRGRDVARAALEIRPGAVGALLGADPAGRLLEFNRLQDAEELPQQQVFGVHRDVRAQLALPPTGDVLASEQVRLRTLDRHPDLIAEVDVRERRHDVLLADHGGRLPVALDDIAGKLCKI